MYRSTFSWPRHLLAVSCQLHNPAALPPGTHWIGGWEDLRACQDVVEKRQFLILTGLELRPLGRPVLSQSIYRLRYPGSILQDVPWVYAVRWFLRLVWVKKCCINMGHVLSGFGAMAASSRSAWWVTFTPEFCKWTSFPVRECSSANAIAAGLTARTPSHFSGSIPRYLDNQFSSRWLGHGAMLNWPQRSPDLGLLDSSVSESRENLVYERKLNTRNELV
jgi:hypothetical protein